MKIEVNELAKNEVEVKLDNVTVAEILRVYLNEEGIEFAAWRREHPSKPIIFRIKSSGKSVKKAVGDAVEKIEKESAVLLNVLKKK